MRILTTLSLSLALGSTLAAQSNGPLIATSTDYGVLARDAQNADFDAVPARTTIQAGLRIHAGVGGNRNGAMANTVVSRAGDPNLGAGVLIQEHGAVFSRDPNGGGVAGTSDSGPTSPTIPTFGPHGILIGYRVNPGTAGMVTILFGGDASQGAGAGVTIDVDGDGQSDFSARANGQAQRAQIPVTAGRNGVLIDILSTGQARLRGAGREAYGCEIRVFFKPGPGTPHCAFTSFGRDCGAHLDGSLASTTHGRAIVLDVTQGPPRALGIMVVGDRLANPMPLPFSRCSLLVDPRGPMAGFMLNNNGEASLRFPLPPIPQIDVNFQGIVVGFNPQGAPTVGTTNGLNLTCR